MKYRVTFNREALGDIERSYEWGRRHWGEELTARWLDELFSTVDSRLASFPLGCPLAPESVESMYEIRQLIFDRYRILYTVRADEVLVIHLRGPHRSR